MSAENITAFQSPDAPRDPSPKGSPARPFLKVAQAGLNTLKEFAAHPEAFLSGGAGPGLSEGARTAWADTRGHLKEFQQEAEIYVRAHPTKSILGAIGVGFVLGVLLKR